MENVRQPVPVFLRREHIDPDQEPSSSRVVNESWINKVFPRHKSEPSPLPVAHVNQGPSFPENIRPDHLSQTPLNNNVGFRKSVPSRYSNKPDINDRDENSRKTISKSSSLLSITDSRQTAHTHRKEDMANILKPMLDKDASSILICWGEKECCHIVPVIVADSADEVTAWREISRAFYASKGSWRRYIPAFGVKQVDVVEISIAGRKPEINNRSTSNIEYVGIHKSEDYLTKRKNLEQIIENYQPQDFPCPYNPSTGTVDCLDNCISRIIDEYGECPEEALYRSQRGLVQLDIQKLLTRLFFHAELAALNCLLNKEGLINGHQDIYRKLDEWHCPELGELQFRGLNISEGWNSNSQHIILPLTVISILLAIIFARFIFNDWGTAWNVGGFLVSLVTLLWMWANHFIS